MGFEDVVCIEVKCEPCEHYVRSVLFMVLWVHDAFAFSFVFELVTDYISLRIVQISCILYRLH